MGVQVEMRVAELLCSRLCHDLVGPVGAVNHGMELIEEENSPVLNEAIEMIGHSARQASNRLEFSAWRSDCRAGEAVWPRWNKGESSRRVFLKNTFVWIGRKIRNYLGRIAK